MDNTPETHKVDASATSRKYTKAECEDPSGICEARPDYCEKPLIHFFQPPLIRAWKFLALVSFLEAFKAQRRRLRLGTATVGACSDDLFVFNGLFASCNGRTHGIFY
jgi:hypothetical protein